MTFVSKICTKNFLSLVFPAFYNFVFRHSPFSHHKIYGLLTDRLWSNGLQFITRFAWRVDLPTEKLLQRRSKIDFFCGLVFRPPENSWKIAWYFEQTVQTQHLKNDHLCCIHIQKSSHRMRGDAFLECTLYFHGKTKIIFENVSWHHWSIFSVPSMI